MYKFYFTNQNNWLGFSVSHADSGNFQSKYFQRCFSLLEETCELTLVAKIQIRAVRRGKHFWPMEWFAEFMKHASAFHSPELQ